MPYRNPRMLPDILAEMLLPNQIQKLNWLQGGDRPKSCRPRMNMVAATGSHRQQANNMLCSGPRAETDCVPHISHTSPERKGFILLWASSMHAVGILVSQRSSLQTSAYRCLIRKYCADSGHRTISSSPFKHQQ